MKVGDICHYKGQPNPDSYTLPGPGRVIVIRCEGGFSDSVLVMTYAHFLECEHRPDLDAERAAERTDVALPEVPHMAYCQYGDSREVVFQWVPLINLTVEPISDADVDEVIASIMKELT
jgi:hypothetical protein